MFLQEAPPDTSGYMIAGYAIFFAISIVYVFSLAVRRRNLEQDLRTLEEMRAESRPARGAGRGRPAGRKPKSRR